MAVMTKRRLIPLNRHPTPAEIRQLREAKGLTREQMAEKIGVQPSTVYGWEMPSQKRRPSPSHVILLRLLEDESL